MTYRRAFIGQLAGVAGATGIAKLVATQRAFAQQLADITIDTGSAGDLAAIRERYLLSPDITYFNHGSIGTIPRIVHEAHARYLEACESNPWLYMWSGEWEEPRERVREKAAHVLGCAPVDLALTHNTTEGFNILANGLPLGPGDEVVFSSMNHGGASVCWEHNAPVRGFTVRRFDFPILDVPEMTANDVLDVYERNISDRTRILVLPDIDNIVGLFHPVAELVRLARSRGVEWIAVDGAQTIGMRSVNVVDLDVDAYCTSPHKWVQAPKGTGLMYVRRELQEVLRPMWVTWGQARWRDSARKYEDYGTRNLPAILALGDALDFQERIGANAKESRCRAIWDLFQEMADSSSRVTWRSSRDWSLSASLFAVEIDGITSTEAFQTMYQNHGFVFRPFRTSELNTIRISPNFYNTEEEVGRFFETVEELE
jgi:selenocysteine lyase/cysteine desulfurase